MENNILNIFLNENFEVNVKMENQAIVFLNNFVNLNGKCLKNDFI